MESSKKPPNFDALRAISQKAEREMPLSLQRWKELMQEAVKAAGDRGDLTEFMTIFAPAGAFKK